MTDFSGLSQLVTAILTPMAVIAVGWLANQKAKALSVTTKETLRQTAEVNHAVNGRGPRHTTIEQDVGAIMAKQEADTPSEVQNRGLVQIVEELLVELKKANGGTA